MAEGLRAEAARRDVTVYQVRKERGLQKGLTASVAVGKPRRGEVGIVAARRGFMASRRDQPSRYRIWWVEPGTRNVVGVQDTDRLPDVGPGDLMMDPFDAGYDDELEVGAVTVAGR